MPIHDTTDYGIVEQAIQDYIKRLRTVAIRNLAYVGEACIAEARSRGSYKDDTANLRSSTGYVIVDDGVVVKASSFEQVKQGAEGAKGGKAFAESLASRYPTNLALIIVAGMNYAVHVSNRGYNVLDSAVLLAKELVPKLLKDLEP